jgi:hypothetical protein
VSRRRSALLVAICLSLTVVAPVSADDTTHERTRSLVAEAVFDPFEGCVEWLVDITPSEDKRLGQSLFLLASAVNGCTGEDVVSVNGVFPLDEGAFEIDHDLEASSLHTTVQAMDRVSGEVIGVTIDLEWVATGDPATRIRFREVIEDSGRRIIQKIKSVSFPAVASGTISLAERSLDLISPLAADLSKVEVDTTIITEG